MKKRKGYMMVTALAAAALTAAVFTGCSNSGKAASQAAAVGSEAVGSGTADSGAEKNSGEQAQHTDYSQDVITYGLTSAWDSINPYGSSTGSIYQNLVSDKLYDRLAFIEEAGTSVSPRGAKSWESADNGMSAIFHLDENAKWHDGEPVTARDWVYTAQLITNPDFDFGLKSEFSSWAGTNDAGVVEKGGVLKVEALDDYTLKMTFKTVTPVENWLLLHNKFYYVLPEHLLKNAAPGDIKTSDFWKAPVGSGPCTYVSEISGNQLELASFADYHLGAPRFGKLILKVVAPTNTITSVSTGELDGFFQPPSVDDAMAAQSLGLQVVKSQSPTSVAVFLINNQNVSDKRVRQAMSDAIDKNLLIDQQLQGQGVASATCIIPGSKYDNGERWERNVDKAKELLAQAGWDPNKKLKMAVTSTRESMAAVIQQNLAEAGIKIEVQTVELATMFSGLQDGTYDLGICGTTAMDDPLWMAGYFDNKNATYCQITDPSYAKLQDEIASELDETKKKELVNQYQELLTDEMPLVILYHGYNFSVGADRFKGYNGFEGAMNNQAVWNWHIEK